MRKGHHRKRAAVALAAPVLAAFVLAAPGLAPVHAAVVAAQSQATIVTSGTLVNSSDLRFGNILPGATLGTVVMSAATNLRTFTGGPQAAGGNFGAADFSALSNPGQNQFLQIILPTTTQLARVGGGAPNMQVDTFNLSGSGVGALNAQGIFVFRVGGTLRVAANQPTGTYTGTFTITGNFF